MRLGHYIRVTKDSFQEIWRKKHSTRTDSPNSVATQLEKILLPILGKYREIKTGFILLSPDLIRHFLLEDPTSCRFQNKSLLPFPDGDGLKNLISVQLLRQVPGTSFARLVHLAKGGVCFKAVCSCVKGEHFATFIPREISPLHPCWEKGEVRRECERALL